MGARTTRITRDEFLTPPEFQGDVNPSSHPAGRVGGASLEFVRRGAKTVLGSCFQQIPVRFFPPFNLNSEPAALLYLISLSAGLMDGDAHLYEIDARAGTRAVVTGQSATRIHPALSSHGTHQWRVNVEDDAYLIVLPGPMIPFKGSRYHQRARAELAPTARLIWGDIWLPGRYERGELSEWFVFDRIVQDFEAHRDGRLFYHDRFRWDGPWTPEDAHWRFGGQVAAASLLVAGSPPEPGSLPPAPDGVLRSYFPLDEDACCLRWCGPSEAVTADVARLALLIAGRWTGGPDARAWLIDSGALAANHWFSPPGE